MAESGGHELQKRSLDLLYHLARAILGAHEGDALYQSELERMTYGFLYGVCVAQVSS